MAKNKKLKKVTTKVLVYSVTPNDLKIEKVKITETFKS